jgi:uncharacterized protein YcfL
MNKNILGISCTLLLLGCSSDGAKPVYVEQVIVPQSQPPLYPDTSKVATVLSKKSLKHGQEKYHVRLADGRELNIILDSHMPYQIGDVIVLPS